MVSCVGSVLMCVEEVLKINQCWKIYDEKWLFDVVWEFFFVSEIDCGFDDGQFWFVFQLKLDIVIGKIIGVEVFVCWVYLDWGVISLVDFILAVECSQCIYCLIKYIVE